MSVPTATCGCVPMKISSSGVINEPPPIPVSPTSTPTPSPNTMITGSMAAPFVAPSRSTTSGLLPERSPGVADQQLDVAVAPLAPLVPQLAAALVVELLRIVVGERARERRELRHRQPERRAGRRRGGRRRAVENRPEDRQRPVAGVHELDQPALLRPVDVRGG